MAGLFAPAPGLYAARPGQFSAQQPLAAPQTSAFARPQTNPVVQPGVQINGAVAGVVSSKGPGVTLGGMPGSAPAPTPQAKPPQPQQAPPQARTAEPAPQAGPAPDPFDEFLKNFKYPDAPQRPPQQAAAPMPEMPYPSTDTPAAGPAAPAAGPTINMPGQAPDVGGGWADFAQRPASPPGLGLSRQSAPMQALRATRATGGLY